MGTATAHVYTNGTAPAAAIVAASYERVSTRRQGKYGFSLGAQAQSSEDFAQARGGACRNTYDSATASTPTPAGKTGTSRVSPR